MLETKGENSVLKKLLKNFTFICNIMIGVDFHFN